MKRERMSSFTFYSLVFLYLTIGVMYTLNFMGRHRPPESTDAESGLMLIFGTFVWPLWPAADALAFLGSLTR